LFSCNTLCVYSVILNSMLNRSVNGKWGFSEKKKKHICVRGVAMNAVDHPNGGRTKSNKPELSPWGWVAKHNK
jgi:ribosomal protein L2